MRKTIRILVMFACFLLTGSAHAEVFNVGPNDDLFGTLQGLQAGDEVIVEDGVYDTGGFFEVTWNGTANDPIVVRAADGARPHIRGVRSQNVINVSGSYYTLRGFEITNGSHGVRVATSDHGTFEDLYIHDINDVGISCNRPNNTYDVMVLRGNEIFDTGATGVGEGMYLGCNNAACVFSNSIVERNFLHDMGGSQGDGIEVKTGSFGNIVRHNVVYRTKFPAITMYGFMPGPGREPNVVEGNIVWGTQDNGIQLVGQVIVTNNIVLQAGASGISSKPSQGFDPVETILQHNTVVNGSGECFRANNWDLGRGHVVTNNVFYCPGGVATNFRDGAGTDPIIAGNVILGSENRPQGGTVQGVSIAADLGDPRQGDVYPRVGSALIGAGDPAHTLAEDFNGLGRADNAPDAGAYEFSTDTNPGWMVSEAFKTLAMTPDPPDPMDMMEAMDVMESVPDMGDMMVVEEIGADTGPTSDMRADSAVDDMRSSDASGAGDGASGSDVSAATDGGSMADVVSGGPVVVDNDDGCGCQTTRRGVGWPLSWMWLMVALGVVMIWRRRVSVL